MRNTDRGSGNRPDPVLYSRLKRLAAPLFKALFRFQPRIDPALWAYQGPAVVAANHCTFMDPVLVALSLPQPVSFVGMKALTRFKPLQPFFNHMGLIPKQQFTLDLPALKAMLRLLRQGGWLGVFPEAQRSLDGSALPFDSSLIHLARRSHAAIITVRISGAYMAWPRWQRGGFHPGQIEAEARLLLTPQQLQQWPVEVCQAQLVRELAVSFAAWQRHQTIPVRYRQLWPNRHLSDLLEQCPRCHRHAAMRASGRDGLTCRFCHYRVRLRTDGLLYQVPAPARQQQRQTSGAARPFSDLEQWHQWQIAQWRQQLLAARLPVTPAPPAAAGKQAVSGRGSPLKVWPVKVKALESEADRNRKQPWLARSGAWQRGLLAAFPDGLRFSPQQHQVGLRSRQPKPLFFPLSAANAHLVCRTGLELRLQAGTGPLWRCRPRRRQAVIQLVDFAAAFSPGPVPPAPSEAVAVLKPPPVAPG
ncbi:MAG: lysophospholipid acyltransferase family protein [Oscillospiraceae bacterium]|nr:lysophospholipid acyltransferase family protein [Oscillospiraceae bacterium]